MQRTGHSIDQGFLVGWLASADRVAGVLVSTCRCLLQVYLAPA